MLKLFSPHIFAPDGIEADLERRVISGGTALNGEEDVIATDGGGRWFFELTEPYLDDIPVAKAWRATAAYLDGGARPIIVSLCDCRYQPTSGFSQVPHSDGTPFSDDTEYSQGSGTVVLAAAAALRATSVRVTIESLPDALIGGERFSIRHETMLDRWYQIVEVLEGGWLTIRPPLREATPAGAELNFDDPRCVMRLDGEMRSPTTLGFIDSTGARFVEHFPGLEGYF